MRTSHRNRQAFLRVDQLDDRCLLSGFTAQPATGYTPAQITRAYDLNAISFTSPNGATVVGNGAGETIALIEEYNDPNIQSDLKVFDAEFGLPNPSLTVVNQAGHVTDESWSFEESMDVEYAHAIAPGAKILVVEAAPSPSLTRELQNLMKAINTARNTPGVVAISMSWGDPEFANEASYDKYFTTPAGHEGITFIASSGDYAFSEYPAASPNVLSVGGTTLTLGSSEGYGSETAWFYSGGGYSPFEPEPSYQRSVQQTGQRSTPDVAFDGDPSTSVSIYETSPRSAEGSWQIYAGTSLGAPVWAGIIAIVDQGRHLAGKGSLDGPTQTLPALYALPSSAFHTVAPYSPWGGLSSWLSDLFGPDDGATANIATGLGTPVGKPLIQGLVATSISPLKTDGSDKIGGKASLRGSTHTKKLAGSVLKHRQAAIAGQVMDRVKTRASISSERRLFADTTSSKLPA